MIKVPSYLQKGKSQEHYIIPLKNSYIQEKFEFVDVS
jgi:hypothetical protein